MLSSSALAHFGDNVYDFYDQNTFCSKRNVINHGEDTELSYCLMLLGILAEDTLDEEGLQRIGAHFPHPDKYNPESFYWKGRPNIHPDKPDCCSKSIISYHRPFKGISENETREWMELHEKHNVERSLESFPIPPKAKHFSWDTSVLPEKMRLTDSNFRWY